MLNSGPGLLTRSVSRISMEKWVKARQAEYVYKQFAAVSYLFAMKMKDILAKVNYNLMRNQAAKLGLVCLACFFFQAT